MDSILSWWFTSRLKPLNPGSDAAQQLQEFLVATLTEIVGLLLK